MVNKDLGMVTAYAYAVSKGYTGTEEEFATLMADYADVGQAAVDAALAAKASEDAAKASETAAEASETAAATSAGTATTAAQTASQAAQIATTKASEATTAASTATTKAAESSQSSAEAAASATTAGTAATNAQTAQTAAEAAQTAAETAQGAAEDAAESVEGKAAQIDQNTADISLVKSHLEAVDATLITEEASGTIASFTDGADGYPMRSVEVSMEPIQDLHGQANPYPAGGGKNLLDINSITVGNATNWSVEVNGDTLSVTHKTEYSTGTPSFSFTQPSGTYVISIGSINVTGQVSLYINGLWSKTINNGDTFTIDSANTNEIKFSAQAGQTTVITKIQIEKGTTATSYAPYSNICPISGRQSVTVTRAGKNLFSTDLNDYKHPTSAASVIYEPSDMVFANGEFSGTVPSEYRDTCVFTQNVPFKAGTYTLSFDYINGSGNTSWTPSIISYYNDNNWYIGFDGFQPKASTASGHISKTFTATKDFYVNICLNSFGNAANTAVNKLYNLQLEYASSASDYVPHEGQSITIQLGQTVYGGTVDVTSGEMVVDRAIATFDGTGNGYSLVSSGRVNCNFDSPVYYKQTNQKFEVSNLYPAVKQTTSNNDFATMAANYNTAFDVSSSTNTVRIKDPRFTDLDTAKALLAETPLVIAVKLAAPLTITLTPEQLTTVLGTNNVWSDADSVSVDYVADTKLYISKVISAAVAALS